jgi:iron(III) transport system ATP-binding protein
MLARYPHQLSAGQQQRAVLARGLVLGTPALLFDEILSAQSEVWAERIARLLNVLVLDYGRMVFMACHDPDWVELHADRVVQLASINGTADEHELLSEEQVFSVSYSGAVAGWLESRKEHAKRSQAADEAKTALDQ